MANRIVNTSWRAFGTKVLPLGERGENDVTQIVCDVSAPLEQYPYAAFSLIASNANGEEYPVQKAVLEGNSLIWTVTKADTAYAGSGWVQAVMFGAEGEIAKTPKNATLVNESLEGDGEPPKPVENWLEEAQKALSSIPSTIGKALAEAEESGKFDGFSPVVELRRVDGGVEIKATNRDFQHTEIVFDGTGSDTPGGGDGFSPIVEVESIEDGHRVSITDKEGKKTFDVMNGEDGKDGVSVSVESVSESDEDGGNNVVKFNDGKTLTIKNGKKGDAGYTPVKGKDYTDGKPGNDGFSPTVKTDAIADGHRVTITDAEGTKTFDVMNGEKGDAFTYADFTHQQLEELKGAPGYTPQKGKDYFDGEDGEDGVSPVVETSAITGGHRVSITDKNGKKSFDVLNGKDGEAFTYDDFTAEQLAALKGPKGDTPVKGKDYFTDADKEEIAESAAERVQIPVQSVNGKTGAVKLSAQDVSALPSDTSIPAKTSELTNDSGFITKAVSDLASYYTKSETYTREEINQRIGAIQKFTISVVSALPTTGISDTTIYLVSSGSGSDLYTEYIHVNGEWEILGSQRVDLTGYATEAWVENQLGGYQAKGDYALKSELPTKLSQLSEDSTHRVVTDAEKEAWSGKLDESKLPEAVEDALAQAKASGEFDGEDGTSATIKTTAITGGHRVTITDKDGTKTVDVMNGEPGQTPQKGVDFWTPADQEDIVQQVIAALGTPVFGTLDENNVITLSGELADGRTYTFAFDEKDGTKTVIGTYVKKAPPSYTNALKASIDSDGQPYNGGKGWKDGYRLNSSAAESQDAAADVTGFIAARWGNTLYLDGVTMSPDSSNASKAYMYMYDSSFKNMGAYFRGDTNYSSAIANGGITLDENRNVKSIVLSDKTFTTVPANIENARYVRFSCEQITDESIVTVNEPIE